MGSGIHIQQVLLQYVCLLFSLCVHEAAHAAMAERRGDPSARLMGRVTLNPLAHIDPVGTVVMPLAMMFFGVPFLFGWAKPVPFNPANLKNIRRDPVLIAAAGPASNFLLAITSGVALRIIYMIGKLDVAPLPIISALMMVVSYLIVINLILLLFNLIPVPPLDGHHVLYYFLPPSGQQVLEQIGPFGIIIALVVARNFLHAPLSLLHDAVLRFAFLGTGVGG